jgi:D-alanine-D-alanine ligase
MTKHVAVLLGGMSSEREVSLESGSAVAKALAEIGYKVSKVDVGEDIAEKLKKISPDMVFNALHGTFGEDGCIQGVLEILKIPYTHSGIIASAVAMDKPLAKVVFATVGIECPVGKVMKKSEIINDNPFSFPFVVKPTNDGSSVGVTIVDDENKDVLQELGDSDYLVERFIPGRELSVAVKGGKALGVIEIKPRDGFYDYKNKYTSGMTEYIMPAPVSDDVAGRAMEMSEKAHDVLGCRGVTRADIRFDEENNVLSLLEINTHPGMTPLSLVPKIAEHAGISFNNLVEYLVESAKCDNS